jgi:hypothetical protein
MHGALISYAATRALLTGSSDDGVALPINEFMSTMLEMMATNDEVANVELAR